ncbi:MAG: NADH-quinone oxidoreductase subunit NuoK [Phycisphaerae bacterium]|nr:NADH-quinone oxidoreductase subunit NuoK [Phycisphaerae bacterium]
MIAAATFAVTFNWQCMLLGAVLFGLGLVGFLARRNLIIMFLSTEVMLQGVLVNLLGFNRLYPTSLNGQSFALFLLVVAAVEAAIGLGLIVLLFRLRRTLDSEAWRSMKG